MAWEEGTGEGGGGREQREGGKERDVEIKKREYRKCREPSVWC